MFAHKLNPEQRQALFDLAASLAAEDEEVSEEEVNYLKHFSETFNIEYNLDTSDLDINKALKVFVSNESRIIALQELIKLSYKDGHFGKEERDKVFLISQKMGLNDADLMIRIENWVRQGFDWMYEGEQILAHK